VREAGGATIVFRGPTQRALMTLVGAPAGHALRGPSMLLAVLAEAADNYKVAYMLAEIDEQFGAKTAILALTQDGHALPARDGPLRIVVAGEEHHARWIRQVVRLRLVRVGG
jgi:DMSO/TMAO reductase YedYZ molybdopterin-dependent catalytic subunit